MKTLPFVLLTLALPAFADDPTTGHQEFFGPLYQPRPAASTSATGKRAPAKPLDAVRRWNEIAINASGLDHTPVAMGEARVFGEQLGPCRASRAMAIVHIAMFDTANSVGRKYESYTGIKGGAGTPMRAAVSQAAHDTLSALFPSQTNYFKSWLADDLAQVKSNAQRRRGILLGQRVAARILELRAHDGSHHTEMRLGTNELDFHTSDLPGYWRQDPVSLVPIALGARWTNSAPFVLESCSQFRLPPPPALDSAEYALAFLEAKLFGGDGTHTPTARTPEQTRIGTFWAYDGTPSLCAPPRLYNQIATHIADQMDTPLLEQARLLALANVAMSDAGSSAWDSKYTYDFWRPVTGVREADPGTGPTSAGDGNPDTIGDETFMPLGAPASNLNGPNFTPPFPAYPSGHATFGAALFQTLRRFYGRDDIAFTFVSDEFNGETLDNQGHVRPYLPRSFDTLSQAEEENGQSRIYLGIHWSFDKSGGITQGRQVGDYVFDHTFRKRDTVTPQ